MEEEQPDYLNCVAEVECDLPAVELLRLCQGIEVALGRDRKGERAPRTVDIDLLLYGEGVIEGRDFRVPHRGISRAYNLVGLADLDPSVRVPGLGAVADLLAGGDLDGVREYEDGEEAVPVTLRGLIRGAREGSGGEIVGRRAILPSGPGAGIWKEEKMSGLAETRCTACRGDEPTLNDAEIGELSPQVPDWRIEERHGVKRLKRAFRFGDFGGALDFTDGVGERAEQAGHHPALLTEWGRVTVTWWTHKIGGLHLNDFVMAARTDELYGASRNETSA